VKVCALLSGGKDSNYALYKAIREGAEVSCIVIVHPMRDDSWMFHTINTRVAVLQAEAMGFKSKTYNVEVTGVKEEEVEELRVALAKIKNIEEYDTILVGALSSRYQVERVKHIASKLGVKVYAPNWGLDPEEYLKTLVREGFKFIITNITVMGLPFKLLGKPIGLEEVEEIVRLAKTHHFNPAFEGGEAETLVYDAPHYKKTICIEGRRVKIREFEYKLLVEKAKLEEKGSHCIKIL
jgi:ABC transporter with metal-binding/Fe-S-binding domain ATP-binding protein